MSTIYAEVTASIIEAIESKNFNPLEWVKNGRPKNMVSQKPYSGMNFVILSMIAHSKGWQNEWMTFKQASEAGYNVKKGEKGSKVIFYKTLTIEKDEKESHIPMLKHFFVFNRSQLDGVEQESLPIPKPRDVREMLCIVSSETIIKKTGANIKIGADRAFYSPASDIITMPEKHRFENQSQWFSVLFHELGHWTSPRLERMKQLEKFNVQERYAREELVAELSAAMVCGEIGFDSMIPSHANYIDSWLQVLKNDDKAIFKAAAMAQKAADFILQNESKPSNSSK